MGTEDPRHDPVSEELIHARRTSGRFWALQWLRMPDFAEVAGRWADLPSAGRWIIVSLVIGVIVLVPALAIVVALLG